MNRTVLESLPLILKRGQKNRAEHTLFPSHSQGLTAPRLRYINITVNKEIKHPRTRMTSQAKIQASMSMTEHV